MTKKQLEKYADLLEDHMHEMMVRDGMEQYQIDELFDAIEKLATQLEGYTHAGG